MGCLRKLQGWSMASIFDEYRRFSGAKLRIADQEVNYLFGCHSNIRFAVYRSI